MVSRSIYRSIEGKRRIQRYYETYLNVLPVVFERRFILTDAGKTHVLVTGPQDAKPLFILQGGNCIYPMTLSWFTPLLNQYRIYAPDTIGHPGFSEEKRISAKGDCFAKWIIQLMDSLKIANSAFIGPSYGAGIVLRLATYHPERISCSALVAPAGISLGLKTKMVMNILIPLFLYRITSSQKQLKKITTAMSDGDMGDLDQQIIGDIFKYVKLEQDMPKLTEKKDLLHYYSPTLVITGVNDIFFPVERLSDIVKDIIPNLITFRTIDMGHFPSNEGLLKINNDITDFLDSYY
ncbi:alpha/beta hydrolase [Bacillus carboniphilus]|uniref:Alpha/beta hydrolase n=1 Tax=Bacillus carboniphilus TaxID=86663 RepID=A0ABY9JS65_9BACI|nr:alpha/beta hydrolase [Bacillus carboniphilus]WLR41207.1 alpha/beta hydrolase [Bacillus carboniphilus]